MKLTFSLSRFTTILCVCLVSYNSGFAQIITHIGGNGASGYSGDGGVATAASMYHPFGIKTDNAGNIYFADNLNDRIRKIDHAGTITTIAGGGAAVPGNGGPATAASLSGPVGVVVDAIGNVYFSDLGHSTIRKVDTSGIITTIAGTGVAGFSGDGGPATAAQLNYPQGMAGDAHGNLYVTEEANHRVRKIDTAGIITTIAGSGPTGLSMGSFAGDGGAATAARLKQPYGVYVDNAGNVYICDSWNNRIRKVDTAGYINTVAGGGTSTGDGGPATAAQILVTIDVVADNNGNMYISDGNGCRIRKVSAAGIISSVTGDGICSYTGDGGMATAAEVNHPGGLAVDECGNVFIADWGNNRIRKINYCIPTAVTANATERTSLKITPNPNNGDFTMVITSAYDEKTTVIISDVTGKKINEYQIPTNSDTNIRINAPKGIYFLHGSSAHGMWTRKLVIQ